MRSVLFAALALLSAACVTGNLRGEHVVTGPGRAPYAGTVRVVMEGAPVPADAEELGIVTASGWGAEASLPSTIGVLQSEAAAIGANADDRVRYDRGATGATATGVAVWLR